MKRFTGPLSRALGLITMAVLLLTGQNTAIFAQQEPPGSRPTPSPDVVEEVREPIVVSQEVLPNDAIRTTIQLEAIGDAYIASERPHENFDLGPLFLGYNLQGDFFGAERIFLKFNVEGNIPADAIIHSATIYMRLSYVNPADDTAMGSVVRRVASPWDEDTVTWNLQPSWGDVYDTTYIGDALTWYGWEITNLVTGWLDETYVNYGVEFIGDEAIQQRERAFYGRLSNYAPYLEVDYTDYNDVLPPVVTVDELPTYSPRSFEVTWDGYDQGAAGIHHYDVQYRIDGGAWDDWVTDVTFTSAVYTGQNGRLYEFRARGVDNVGNEESYGEVEAGTTVDSAPPTSQVSALPKQAENATFTVNWSGTDHGGSGIQYYDILYKHGNGEWLAWQQKTVATNALFTASEDGIYKFEARAVDKFGRVEPLDYQAEASIIVDLEPPFIQPRLWLPLTIR